MNQRKNPSSVIELRILILIACLMSPIRETLLSAHFASARAHLEMAGKKRIRLQAQLDPVSCETGQLRYLSECSDRQTGGLSNCQCPVRVPSLQQHR